MPAKRAKSLELRVTTVMAWTNAVAPMKTSRYGAGAGTFKVADRTATA